MKKHILFFGALLTLAGCQEKERVEVNVIEDKAVKSLSVEESNSEIAHESSAVPEAANERDDLLSVFNKEDPQAAFQELVGFIESEGFLIPNLFVDKSEANYFSGYAYSFGYGDAAIHTIESDSLIPENIDYFKNSSEEDARTNMGIVTYGTAEAAENQVQHEDAHQLWLENQYNQQTLEFDLGNGVTGYMIGNTSDQTLSWNDGNWYVEFYSYDSFDTLMIANLGIQLVQQLQNTPLPSEVGTGHYYLAYDGMTGEWFSRVLWTVDEVRYEINTSRKGTSAVVEMARAMMELN